MSMIYITMSFFMGLVAYIDYSIKWVYYKPVLYVALALMCLFFDLIFLQQDGNVNKKYKIFTIRNIVLFLIIGAVYFWTKEYDIADFELIKYSFIKLIALMNFAVSFVLLVFYKVRSIFYNW